MQALMESVEVLRDGERTAVQMARRLAGDRVPPPEGQPTLRGVLIDSLEWLGHSGFRIRVGRAVVYLDPYRVPDGRRRPT